VLEVVSDIQIYILLVYLLTIFNKSRLSLSVNDCLQAVGCSFVVFDNIFFYLKGLPAVYNAVIE